MARDQLTKVTATVALSYLVLIPVGAVIVYLEIERLKQEVDNIWANAGFHLTEQPPLVSIENLKNMIRGSKP